MKRLNSGGQTLIALLIFMMLTITITVTAASVTVINTQSNTAYTSGDLALQAAESGAENALLQLERNPGYTGETMNINSFTTATISVSGTSTKTVTVVGKVAGVGTFVRTIVVTAAYANNAITVTNWEENP